MAIGVDIEDISRFKDRPDEFIKRIFTKSEIRYCTGYVNPESHFAVRFCAKEAVIKALSALDFKGIMMSDIEVYHDKNNCPNIRLSKDIEQKFDFELSLSHDRTKAIAFVIARAR